jgi:4-amino-4-deoxy-L-arabinose transferase-like glycosyltransferase
MSDSDEEKDPTDSAPGSEEAVAELRESASEPNGEPVAESKPEEPPLTPASPEGPPASRDSDPEDPIPKGNKPNWVRGGVVAVIGAAIPFLVMATDRHFSFSVPLCLAALCISAFGIFDLLGTFGDKDESVAARADATKLRGAGLELLTSLVAWFVAMRLAVSGSLPLHRVAAAVLVTGTFLWLVTAAFRALQALGAFQDRGLLKREGFWLIVLVSLLYLPMLGSYSLSDPWETHYGEVAREMLARDDWISLWWAQDGWFHSKPVLDFWIQGIFFSALGVRYMPDQMLSTVAQGRLPQPEWACRMPIFLLTLAGMYFLYKGCAKAYGRRAGFLGAVVLATVPYWYFVAHQSMTDMPYVAPLCAAMGLMLLGFHTDPDETIKTYELSIGSFKLRLSLWHAVFGFIVLCALPQILYLATRNLTLQLEAPPFGFRTHFDEFMSGSGGGNCNLPGNEACRKTLPLNRTVQPWMSAVGWAAIGGALLWFNRGERRRGRLYFIAAWTFVALSAMGKGAPGLVLPVAIAVVYIAATRRWKDLTRIELLSLALVVACVTLPWYVQMYMRHGQVFTDRLLGHDMYKRAFVHVHDTNVGDDVSFRYYVWQLGYGLFPWTGFALAGLGWWLRRPNDRADAPGDAGGYLALWWITAFGMFTITLTKFHHYILPVVPPTAMLVGVMFDRTIDRAELPDWKKLPHYLGGMLVAATLCVYGACRLFPGSLLGSTIKNAAPPASRVLGVACLVLGAGIGWFVVRAWGRRPSPKPVEPSAPIVAEQLATSALTSDPLPSPDGTLAVGEERVVESDPDYDRLIVGAMAIAAAVVIAVVGRDLFTTLKGDIDGQARLMHLFTYNYRRPWPESLDFDGILKGLTLVSAAACLLVGFARRRTHAVVFFFAVSIVCTLWAVNVYLVKSSPHWGQRETLLAYYADRPDKNAPFVAYQMNWKGENFYTGNRVPAFVSSGQKFKDWIAEQRKNGVTTMYFTTEHGRVQSLKSEVGEHKTFDVITTPELNNKFFTARVRF